MRLPRRGLLAGGWSASDRRARYVLAVVDGFAALTAIGSGIALATGLEGGRFPLEWLSGTSFESYVVPGLILIGVVGGSAAIAMAPALRSPTADGKASLIAGAIMMGWITGKVLILPPAARSWIETLFADNGILILALGGLTTRRV